MLHSEPFAFARFNDGEMGAITGRMKIVSRGTQDVTPKLRDKLYDAISYEADDYIKGHPCPECYHQHYNSFFEMSWNQNSPLAVCLVNNGHWKKFADLLPKFGECVKLKYYTGKNAFDQYDDVKDDYKEFEAGDIVLISGGPMSRILVCEWWQKRQDCTFIDIGSTIDPIVNGNHYRAHSGTLPHCSVCNYG
jgi:hypothetical protein